jgi:hypothetical protein
VEPHRLHRVITAFPVRIRLRRPPHRMAAHCPRNRMQRLRHEAVFP